MVAKFFQVLFQAQGCEFPLKGHPEVHVVHGVDDDVDELHAGDHEFDLETFRVHEVVHHGLESPGLQGDILEVVEGTQDDLVAAFDQADGGQEFKHKCFRSQLLVDLKWGKSSLECFE